MSDGPHRSLPMPPGWKRVAERGDKCSFSPEEVKKAIIPALQRDCRQELRPEFLGLLIRLCGDQESSLFKEELATRLESLKGAAQSEFERTVVGFAAGMSSKGSIGNNLDVKALATALTDRAARGARQVEEHYYRKSTVARAHNVRARIEQAIGDATKEIADVARRQLNGDRAGPAPRSSLRQQGLDDGVPI